jgi:hypothetical protein
MMKALRENARRPEEANSGVYRKEIEMGKVVVIAVVAMALLVMSPARIFAQASDPASVADAFNKAALDPQAELGMVTDDVMITVVPPPPGSPGVWSDKAQAQAFFEFVKGQNVHRELAGSWQMTGDKVTGTVMVTNNDFANWGVGAVQHQLEFVVQDGKIKSFTSIMAPSERPRVMAAAQAYQSAHPAQAPAGMPRTGADDQSGAVQLGLLVAALFLMTAGITVRKLQKSNRTSFHRNR